MRHIHFRIQKKLKRIDKNHLRMLVLSEYRFNSKILGNISLKNIPIHKYLLQKIES